MFIVNAIKSAIDGVNLLSHNRFYFKWIKTLVTSNTEDIRFLSENEHTRSKVSRDSLRLTGVGSYVTYADDDARQIRKVMIQHFNPALYIKICNHGALEFFKSIKSTEPKNNIKIYDSLRVVFDRLMLDEFLGVIFTDDLIVNLKKVTEKKPDREESFSKLTFVSSLPIPFVLKKLMLRKATKWASYRREMAQVIYKSAALTGAKNNSYLNTLLKYEKEGIFTHQNVLGEINSAFDGSNSMSTSLTWAILCLANNESLQEKCKSHEYAKWCYFEALRLYPPFHLLDYVKKSSNDLKKACPFSIIKNKFLFKNNTLISVLGVHTNSKYWNDTSLFRPERWKVGLSSIERGSFIPFGIGERACPAKALSVVVCSGFLNQIFSANYRFKASAPMPTPKRFYFLTDQDQSVEVIMPSTD